MSFFSDPKLFLMLGDRIGNKFIIVTVPTKPGCLFGGQVGNYHAEVLNFSEHLSLPHNKESDFESLFAYLSKNDKLVNCQGIVINWFLNDIGFEFSWSPEGINLSSYGIHGLVSHQENEADARKIERDRDEEHWMTGHAVPSYLVPFEHWMTGHAVPNYLVPFEDLDVLSPFPRNTPLTITKATPTTAVIDEDKSTNVKVSRFYGGVFPIVLVNVDELVPDKENARFDPDIWGLFHNKGTTYAARKPFKSEML